MAFRTSTIFEPSCRRDGQYLDTSKSDRIARYVVLVSNFLCLNVSNVSIDLFCFPVSPIQRYL